MKKIKSLTAILIIIIMFAGLTGCQLITKSPEGIKNTVVAKVGSEKITKGEYEKRLPLQIAQIEAYYGEGFLEKSENASYLTQVKQQLLDTLVQEKVMMKKAEELKIVKDEKELNTEVEKSVANAQTTAGGEAKFKEQLQKYKLTIDDYKALEKNQLIFNKLYEYVIKDVKVSDTEAKTYYDGNLYSYTEKPDVMNVSHILLKTSADAEKVRNEILKGAKFEDEAKKYSIDTGSKDKGGLLGDIEYTDSNYDSQFMATAISLPVGKISPVTKTQFGYHIIRINSKKEYKVKPFDTVKAEIKSTLLEQDQSTKFQNTIKEWEGKLKITKYTDKL